MILDGKATAEEILKEITEEVIVLLERGGKKPHLAAILVGNDGASETYVASKVRTCESLGFNSSLFRYDADVSEEKLLSKIEDVNADDDIDGLIVQLPLPRHISVDKVIETIAPEKDVDGFHPINVGRMVKGLPAYISATPYGILMLLEKYKIETSGKHCVVVGRSQIVGSPMSILMARNTEPGNCTVTLTHSRTRDLPSICRQADILIVALGNAEFITADMVKEGAVVIDVGITRVDDANAKRGYVLKGDVAYDEVAAKASYITPVPGGVGRMTIVGLMKNTLLAAQGKIFPEK